MTIPGPPSERWDRLAEEACNIFATRSWAECWWSHYGGGATPMILTDNEDAPTYVLPLYLSGGFLKKLRFIGNGPADQLGPVCGPGGRDAAAEAMRSVLGDPLLRCDVFLAQDVPEVEAWDARFEGSVVRRVASPVVRFDTDVWDDFLAQKSKNFREQTRRRERKLGRSFAVELRLSTAESLSSDMATLFRLHLQQWGQDAPFATGIERRFHEDFALVALENGWLRLWMLELDGSPVAALYGFRFAGVEYFYQSGRAPAYEEHSVGSVLLTHSIRSALQDGMKEYRLLRGDEAYKSRFADHENDVHTVAVPRTFLGRAAVKAALLRRDA